MTARPGASHPPLHSLDKKADCVILLSVSSRYFGRLWLRRVWRGVVGVRTNVQDTRAARLGAVLGVLASLLAGSLAVWFIDMSPQFSADPLGQLLVIGWTVPGGLYAGWRLAPGALRGCLVWAAVRFGLLTTVATAAFWLPVAVAGLLYNEFTSTGVTVDGTTVGAGIDPVRVVFTLVIAPLFALYIAGFFLVITSPIVVPVSFGWAAALRRAARPGEDAGGHGHIQRVRDNPSPMT